MDYFARSQLFRKEILETPDLLERLEKDAFSEKIGFGDDSSVYRIGRLISGMWIALRVIDRVSPDNQMYFLEAYARKAEYHFSRGERPVHFCVGFDNDTRPGLLVEDLTAGGLRTLSHAGTGEVSGQVTTSQGIEEVLIDLKLSEFPRASEFKYFSPEHMVIV